MQLSKTLAIIILSCLPSLLLAQKTIILGNNGSYAVENQVEELEDKTHQLGWDRIFLPENQTNFHPISKKELNRGYSLANYWLRFKISTEKLYPHQEWFIQFRSTSIDTLDVYFLSKDNQLLHHYQAGDMLPFSVRPVRTPNFLFPIPFTQTNELIVYVNLQGYFPKNHDFRFIEKNEMLDYLQFSLIFRTVLHTIILALMLYNFLFFWTLRDRTYLYYVAYVLFALIYFLSIDGFTGRFWYPNKPYLSHYFSNIPLLLSGVFVTFFAINFLRIKTIKGVSALSLWLGWCFIGICTFLPLILKIRSVFGISSSMFFLPYLLFTPILISVLGAWAVINKIKEGKIFFLASFSLLSGILIDILKRLQIDIPSTFSENSFQIGIVAEALFFSIALAQRIKFLDEERREAQIAKIKALQENESMIREQNILLEQKVKERTEEIAQQNKELGEVNAIKDKLFGIIGHDLRSPIASLKLLVDSLSREFISKEEFLMYLDKLNKGLDHVLFTLNNLLIWSHTQMKGGRTNFQHIDIHEIAAESLDLLRLQAEAKNTHLVNEIDKEVRAFADSNQIDLVLRNLISNAIKFTGKAGIITLKSNITEDWCEIAVSDTGKGMTKEDSEKLFNNEQHFSKYGTAGEKGTGLGLLLCQEMIKNNKGKIWVESEIDKGTTFWFALPYKK